jgi:heme/copper-type cytochrome/quinol oxidase subunit 4
MSSALALAGPNLWAPTDSPHAKYWSSYGMNWACKIDEQLCLKISKNPAQYKNQLNLAIGAALTNPIEYTNERLKFFIQNWFPEDKGTIDFLISIIFILIPFYTVYYVIRIRDKRKHLVTLLWVPFITWQLIAYTLVHYERRYFIPFHFFTFCYFLSAIILKKSEDLSKSRTLS